MSVALVDQQGTGVDGRLAAQHDTEMMANDRVSLAHGSPMDAQ